MSRWCLGSDKSGRIYTFRLTARDRAGNRASTEAIVAVVKHGKRQFDNPAREGGQTGQEAEDDEDDESDEDDGD